MQEPRDRRDSDTLLADRPELDRLPSDPLPMDELPPDPTPSDALSAGTVSEESEALLMQNITLAPFLTFSGQAEDAMAYYKGVFPDAIFVSLVRIEDENIGAVGKVLNGQMLIKGQMVMFMDMPEEQAVPFSWAVSLYVNCTDEAEFDTIFDGLSKGGTVMMGPAAVMNLRKAAWVSDQFGVTWQLVWI